MAKAISRSISLPKPVLSNIFKVSWLNHISIIIVSFLLAKAVFMGELYPFGVAFLAAVCISKPRLSNMALLGVIAGDFAVLRGWNLASYLLGLILVYFIFSLYNSSTKKHWLMGAAVVMAVHILSRGGGILLTRGEFYQWVGLLFEGFFVGILTIVAVVGIQAYPKILHGEILSAEERTSLGIIILGLLLGISAFNLWGIGLQSILSRWLVLWGALLAGPGGGAAVGVAVGLVPSIEGILNTGPIAFYALSGLLGGIFNNFNKIGVIIGFALANLLLTLFFSEQVTILQTFKETGIAALGFLLLNTPSLQKSVISEGSAEDKKAMGESNSYLAEKLAKISDFVREVEKMMQVTESPKNDAGNELNILFNKVGAQVCEGCSLYRVCWKQDFYKTYRSLLEACTKLETNGHISEKDFGHNLKRRCMRLRELSVALNSQLEVLKLIKTYERRMDSCRRLLSQQLNGMAKIMQDVSEELSVNKKRDQESPPFIIKKLNEKGIFLRELQVIENRDGEKEIIITQEQCNNNNWCKGIVAPNISQIMGRTYEVKKIECASLKQKEHCRYVLSPVSSYRIVVGKAECAKDGGKYCGDSCASFALPDNRFALVISDGMGIGKEASTESNAAINLLNKLLVADFSPERAVNTVNTALFLRSFQEKFATLDVVIINQLNGYTDFIKIGGAPSFICSNSGVKIVQAPSPPVGILERIETKTYRYSLTPGNIIIMMSDGVWDAIYGRNEEHGWWDDILKQLSFSNPQQAADYLMFLAKKASGDAVKDDMCVQIAVVE